MVSTLVGVACLAVAGAAGYTFATGESVCSLLGSCDTDATAVSVVETAAMSDDAVVVIPAALASSDAGECEGEAKAECAGDVNVVNAAVVSDCETATSCDGGAKVVHASETSDECAESKAGCCDAEKTADNAEAVVVNAALVSDEDGETKACCQDAEKTKVENVAIATGECEALTDECAEEPMQTSPIEIMPVNASCPLTEEPLTPGLASVHEGFTVGFCCNGCKRKWDARADAEKADYIVMNAKLVNEMCPTCPTMKAKKTSASLYNGFAVGFCNDHCKGTFDAKDDAGKTTYIASIVTPVNENCPFSDEAVDAEIVSLYRGYAVAFCCNGCQSRFSGKMADSDRDAMVVTLASNLDGAMIIPAAEAQSCGEGCGDENCGEDCKDKLAEKSKPGE